VPEPELSALPDIATTLGVDILKVRQLLRDGVLLGVRSEDGVLRVPTLFVEEGRVVKHLSSVITVLRDNSYSDDEAIRWLFAEDETLPGSPINALRENRGTEVKRRAQALGW
jgi:hypothetical protein